jgi:hypothetical protein
MSVSVSVLQLRILVVTIVLATVGQLVVISISGGRAASFSFVAERSTGATAPAKRRSERPPTRLQKSSRAARHAHHVAGHSSPPPYGPLSAVLAKARPAFAPSVATVENQEMLTPRVVRTVRVAAAVEDPPVEAETQAAAGTKLGLASIATLADSYDETRLSPMWPDSMRSPPSFATTDLVMLFGACGGIATGIYALIAFTRQRRRPPFGDLQPSHGTIPASSRTNQYSGRDARQRLFPHQFGAAIRSL